MDPQFLKDQINLLKDVSSNLLSDQDTLNLRDSMDILISTTDAKMQKANEINARIKEIQTEFNSAKMETAKKVQISNSSDHSSKMHSLEKEKEELLKKKADLKDIIE
ncbi:hypothetical protein AYI70_g150 [Smittium culicis]|uniref:Uncharacterized protein n=1 Tax=Smittium culicis TaxID=133412 RepID=A0A1R1YHQ8_9FUNG|nr:hypothetical protein AYI70_g150 [Smittium culicis]